MIDLKPQPAAREHYYQAGYWQHQSLAQRIAASVAAYPDKTAVSDASGQHISYHELPEAVRALADGR